MQRRCGKQQAYSQMCLKLPPSPQHLPALPSLPVCAAALARAVRIWRPRPTQPRAPGGQSFLTQPQMPLWNPQLAIFCNNREP